MNHFRKENQPLLKMFYVLDAVPLIEKKNKKQTEKNFLLKYKLVLQFRASAYRLMSFTN